LLDFQPRGIDLQGDAVADLLSLRDCAADLGIGLMHPCRAPAPLEQANLNVYASVQERSLFILRPEEVGGARNVDARHEIGGGHAPACVGGPDGAQGSAELPTVVRRQL